MRVLALDLSKRSTGFACWGEGDEKVASGCWELGSEFTSDGRVFANLHARMHDLHRIARIDALFIEETLDPRVLSGHTNIATLKVLSGLSAHAKSFAEAMSFKIVREVNQTTWRRHFIGSMKRGTKSVDLKDYAMQRARQLGFKPRRHDEAEAIGILDFACDQIQMRPYWVADQVLRAPLVAR